MNVLIMCVSVRDGVCSYERFICTVLCLPVRQLCYFITIKMYIISYVPVFLHGFLPLSQLKTTSCELDNYKQNARPVACFLNSTLQGTLYHYVYVYF